MSHYSDFGFREYETRNGYDTSHDEARHKYLLKEYYEEMNKRYANCAGGAESSAVPR
jgi:hypothetical protein